MTTLDKMDVLKKCHTLIWAFRNKYNYAWKTPTLYDAVKFAFCECGEALDESIRIRNPEYSRNRERNPSDIKYHEELADVVIMILSMSDNFNHFDDEKGLSPNFETVCHLVGTALLHCKNREESAAFPSASLALDHLYNLIPYMESAVVNRLKRIYKKHVLLDTIDLYDILGIDN